ncbi:MAG: hypothetical protein AAGC57_19775 [Pseudomonadota bacterium]
MTIGIAVRGHNSGRAIFAALAAVEAVGSGAIGGFVSAVGLAGKNVLRAETQTGGSAAVRFSTARMEFESATMAALISSGPNRPEPLAAFTLAEPGVGIVTGHRLPTALGQDGVPMNRRALELMRNGASAGQALDRVLSASPDADCGLAAIDAAGHGSAMQTVAAERPDSFLICRSRNEATVCVIHNAIQPAVPLADLAAEIALEIASPTLCETAEIVLARGCPVRGGAVPALVVDGTGRVCEIRLPAASASGEQVLNLGYRPAVLGAAAEHHVLVYEPFVVACDGRVVSIDGVEAMTLKTAIPA